MTRAAGWLHVTQPTLSKQMKGPGQESGKKLFRRGSASVSLTDEGMPLRKRVALVAGLLLSELKRVLI